MAEAGRIKHHIAHGVGDAKNTILLVGYCDPGSLGGRLKAGEKEVRIFGQQYDVLADVGEISGMSAHGDYEDLLNWLDGQEPESVSKLFLVHGEYEVQTAFRERLMRAGYGNVIIPDLHETVALD
jgi:metallo-beta-lactamase family protein